MRPAALWLCAAAALASPGPATAQDDPIGDALRAAAPPMATAPQDEEAAETAPEPAAPPPPPAGGYRPYVAIPAGPQGYIPQPPAVAPGQLYDARVRASFSSAQGLLGPLDGGWTLADSRGTPLYALQLVDKGRADSPIEGVWRDLRRTPTPSASGLISNIDRFGSRLTLSFFPPGRGLARVTLSGAADGRWSGRLDEGGADTGVTMRRE